MTARLLTFTRKGKIGYLLASMTDAMRFPESCGMVMRMLMTLQGASPGRIPELMRDIESMAQMVKLQTRRERAFPRGVKERPRKYPKASKKSQSVA